MAKRIPPTLTLPLKGGRENFVSEAHGKELNVLTSYRLNDFKKKIAFTLAEVLITLAIIGVVAAMTIPTLITKYQEKSTVSKLTKVYATLSNAYSMAKIEHGDFRTWGFAGNASIETDEDGNNSYSADTVSGAELFWTIMTKNLKVLQWSVNEELGNRLPNVYLDGSPISSATSTRLTEITLADGVTVGGGWLNNRNCIGSQLCLDFNVDINGSDNPPNVYGKDIFSFYVLDSGIKPAGSIDEENIGGDNVFETHCDRDSSITQNGYGCAAWVIYNKNMDYLHCDDLSWDGKHKCSD